MAALRTYLWLLVLCVALPRAFAWPTVQYGASGPTVYAIQDLLQARGYSLTVDGAFGPITQTKVKAFQSANGLSADGIVGPLTWQKLVITVQYGSSGSTVHAVQYLLTHKYSLLGVADIDSVFGTGTRTAVVTFQSTNSLTQDGIVGPLTWNALLSDAGATSQPCSSVARSRAGIVAAARLTVGKPITYTQGGSRWSGINNRVCPSAVPPYADCSSFVTWLFWTAYGNGPDFVNNQAWTQGYTGTMEVSGSAVALANAQPGDVVVYFDRSGISQHAALYIGNSQVITFGGPNPVAIASINSWTNVYPTYRIRTYSQVV